MKGKKTKGKVTIQTKTGFKGHKIKKVVTDEVDSFQKICNDLGIQVV